VVGSEEILADRKQRLPQAEQLLQAPQLLRQPVDLEQVRDMRRLRARLRLAEALHGLLQEHARRVAALLLENVPQEFDRLPLLLAERGRRGLLRVGFRERRWGAGARAFVSALLHRVCGRAAPSDQTGSASEQEGSEPKHGGTSPREPDPNPSPRFSRYYGSPESIQPAQSRGGWSSARSAILACRGCRPCRGSPAGRRIGSVR
jgi:hypothetical protein